MKKTYFSIRTVTAKNKKEAIQKVEDNIFDEFHPLCDTVLNIDEFHIAVSEIASIAELYDIQRKLADLISKKEDQFINSPQYNQKNHENKS
jgi:hypothetical protein